VEDGVPRYDRNRHALLLLTVRRQFVGWVTSKLRPQAAGRLYPQAFDDEDGEVQID
jgi:hypothetical protein